MGPSPQWQARLSAIFPTIAFTVCPKADSLFKIVGAASIIAKVTRDRYVHSWVDPEDSARASEPDRDMVAAAKGGAEGAEMGVARGSGYPSDPKTQAFLRESLDPVFGYKGVVRFSWATVKVILEKNGVECKWYSLVLPSPASVETVTLVLRRLDPCGRHATCRPSPRPDSRGVISSSKQR